MPATLEELGIDKLSVADRLALLGRIWDTLTDSVAELPTPAQSDELDRRAADDANPDDVVPWEQVKADALARFAK